MSMSLYLVLQASITKYMPGKRRGGQQTLSPIMESAAEGAREESAETRRKTRGRTPKTDASTGEELQRSCSLRHCRMYSEPPGSQCVPVLPDEFSSAHQLLQCYAGEGKAKAADPEGALSELPEAAEGEPVSPLPALRLVTPLLQDHL